MENTTNESRFNTFKMKVSKATTKAHIWLLDHSSEIKTGVCVAGAAFLIGVIEGFKTSERLERQYTFAIDVSNVEDQPSEEEFTFTEAEPSEEIEG